MHNISHWLDIRDLCQLTGLDIVAAFRSNTFAKSLSEKNIPTEGDQLYTALEDQQFVFQAIVCPALASGSVDTEGKVDTQVTIPKATTRRNFNKFEALDRRDPQAIGAVTSTGDLAPANHLAKSCLRTSRETMARFRRSERLSAAKRHRHLIKLDTLQLGELPVQPTGWFHQVRARNSPNMSTNYFWRYY